MCIYNLIRMNLQPMPLIRQTYDGTDDVNWLWEHRYSRRLIPHIVNYFFSPTIPPIISQELKKKYKNELLIIRRFLVTVCKLRERRRKLRERRRINTADALKDNIYVSNLIDLINKYLPQ